MSDFSFDYILEVCKAARMKAVVSDVAFDECNYVWVLGSEVVKILQRGHELYTGIESNSNYLSGIRIEAVSNERPFKIALFKAINNIDV